MTPYKPKLKIGDTFILTKEMNDKKVLGENNRMDAGGEIGMLQKIAAVGDEGYVCQSYCFNFPVVDPFLPDTTPKPRKDVWERFVRFVQGEIQITPEFIYIDKTTYTHEQFTKQYNLYRRIYRKFNQLKKNKDI